MNHSIPFIYTGTMPLILCSAFTSNIYLISQALYASHPKSAVVNMIGEWKYVIENSSERLISQITHLLWLLVRSSEHRYVYQDRNEQSHNSDHLSFSSTAVNHILRLITVRCFIRYNVTDGRASVLHNASEEFYSCLSRSISRLCAYYILPHCRLIFLARVASGEI
jgi:hypothetical protein